LHLLSSRWETLKKNSSDYTRIPLRMLIFLKKKYAKIVQYLLYSRAAALSSGCYLAYPLSISRRVGSKELKSWYSPFSCLIISIKRMVWSRGVARILNERVLGRRPHPPKARVSGGKTSSSRRFFAIFQ